MIAYNKSISHRVAFVHRGMTKYRLPLYRRLHERGNINFRVFCQKFNLPSELVGFSQPFSTDDLPITWLKAANWTVLFKRCFAVPTPSLGMLPSLVQYRPDVVVFESLSNLASDLVCTPYVRLRKIPFVWWSLGAIPSRATSFRSRCGDIIQKWFVRRAGAVLAYSTHGKQFLEGLGADPNRTFVVYNTLDEQSLLVDIERCRPMANKLRQSLGLTGKAVAVFSGTIKRGKRLDLLIEAFAMIRQQPLPVDPHLLVIGDGVDLPRCQALARNLGIKDFVHLVGRQEENASAYFLLGNFAVLPGLGGLAINHAFVHGLPVICGMADGCEMDLVENGKTGIRLAEISSSSLSNAMIKFFKNSKVTREMGQSAFKLITNKITMDNFAMTIEQAVSVAVRDNVNNSEG